VRAALVDGNAQDLRGALDHAHQLGGRVVVETRDQAEPSAQGRADEPGARRGADEREGLQLEPNTPRVGAAIEHDVDHEVLHRGIEILLDDGIQPMDLVDEDAPARLHLRELAGEISGLLEHRPGRGHELGPHLRRADRGEGGLPEAGRAMEEEVIERLAAGAGGFDRDP
jgi:hypothetical protein